MKEKLLFIAPSVPFYDLQSGDLRLFTILNMLTKFYDLTFFAKNWLGDKLIVEDRYVSPLRNLGINIYVESFPLKDTLCLNRFKAVIMEFYYIAEYYLPRVKLLQPSCPVIVDTVDVHYLRFQRKYQLTKDSNDLQVAEEVKKKELAIYGQAEITLTVTEDDAKTLQKDNPNINTRILPNIHRLVYPTNDQNRNEIIFVGGFGGHEPNIDAVVYFCEDILPRIKNVIPEIRFTVVGSNPPLRIQTLNNDFITVTGYVPSTTPYLQKSYVSVAPLRYGAGMKGKIGEAMSHGLPVVTTTIGAEGMGLTDRENIIIVDSPEKFADAIIELMRDDFLYKKIQKNGLDHIDKNFTPERVGNQMEHILAELADLPVKKMSLLNKTSFLLKYAFHLAKRKLSFPS